MKLILLAAITFSFFLNGCATIMNDDTVEIPVQTTPSNATVILNGESYESPVTLKIPRGKGDHSLHIQKSGYQPVDIKLEESLDGWLWGNLLVGGIIGVGVDFASGDAYDLEPEFANESIRNAGINQFDDKGISILLLKANTLPEEIVEYNAESAQKF